MARKGQELQGPGVKVTILELDPELLTMEVSYDGDARMPPQHYHPSQAEHFTVLQGQMHTVIDGGERVYGEGESFDVPVAARHQMGPYGGPARVRWEVRPAQRTAEFFEILYTGKADENFLTEFANEIRFD
jgi:mannose-6-phosphate isomerase-like protein (cupin superfamily)